MTAIGNDQTGAASARPAAARTVEEIEGAISALFGRLSGTRAGLDVARQRYLGDGLRRHATTVTDSVGSLTEKHPWAFGAFTDPVWDRYRPDTAAPTPDGLRVGSLDGTPGGPSLPAVVRLVDYGHVVVTAAEDDMSHARDVLQALILRLVTATAPGSARFALVDPVGAGRHLSAFLRLPPALRDGSGVAAGPSEIENLLQGLVDHVVEVTQQRLTNVYGSVSDYNRRTTGAQVPFTFLVTLTCSRGSASGAERFSCSSREAGRARASTSSPASTRVTSLPVVSIPTTSSRSVLGSRFATVRA